MSITIGLVVSTLNDGIYRIREMMSAPCDEMIVVHQVTELDKKQAYSSFYSELNHPSIRIITLEGKGLSKSRNAGIAAATADYLLICDDDGVFETDFISTLRNAATKYPDADIFTFKTRTPDGRPYKKYSDKTFQHSKRSTAKVTSREILFKRSWLAGSELKFDERFGLGTSIPTGEEYIFLCDAIKKGAKILFIPSYIVIHPYESSGKQFNEEQIKAKGAVFARTYGWLGLVVCMVFAIKKYDHYKGSVSFVKFVRYIYKGCYQFLAHG